VELREQTQAFAALEEKRAQDKDEAQRKEEAHKKDMGEVTSIVAPGPNGRYDLDNIADQIITGRYENGEFVDDTGQRITNFMSVEQAVSLKELEQAELGKAGVQNYEDLPIDARTRLFNAALPSGERTGRRMQMDALDTQSDVMNSIADMFVEMDEAGRHPGEFLATAGQVTEFVTNVASQATNLGATWNVQIAKGTLDDIYQGTGETMYNGPGDPALVEEYGSLVRLPEGMNAAGDAAAEYRSSIIQLAYAVARSNEPGARQLSDADFRHAMKEIGAAAGDPNRLRRVILANFARKTRAVSNSYKQTGEIGQAFALTDEQAKEQVYGKGSNVEKLERWAATTARFEKLEEDLEVMEKSREFSQQQVEDHLDKVPQYKGTGTSDDPIDIP
jgi:hypothetical protein